MSRVIAMLYAVVAYAVFLLTFLYAIGFVAGVGVVPKDIDDGVPAPLAEALAIDVALLLLFAVQHSGMARPAFKRWWTRLVPAPAERSTYVLLSSLVLALMFWQWRPLPQVAWDVEGAARMGVYGIAAIGWLLVLASTFLINHFDLFGLRQAWFHMRGLPPEQDVPFVTRAFYRIVRHPLMLGFLVAFWAAPTMTLGHLLFSVATTGYILVAVHFLEERDLVAHYGEVYRDYQRRVPMLLPIPKRGGRSGSPARPMAAP